jgi:hypothetical protein
MGPCVISIIADRRPMPEYPFSHSISYPPRAPEYRDHWSLMVVEGMRSMPFECFDGTAAQAELAALREFERRFPKRLNGAAKVPPRKDRK